MSTSHGRGVNVSDNDSDEPLDAGDQPPSGPPDDDRRQADSTGNLEAWMLSVPDDTDGEGTPKWNVEDLLEAARHQRGADRIAAMARAMTPGPRSAELLWVLSDRPLSPAGILDAICAAERLASWTQAIQHRHLADFAKPGAAATEDALSDYASAPGQPLHGKPVDEDLPVAGSMSHGDSDRAELLSEVSMKVASAEVSAALRVSPMNANRRVAQAVDFVTDLPATLTALQSGVIDRGRSLVIAERTQHLPTDLRGQVEAAVVAKASDRTAGQLRAIADRAVIAADPAAAKKRHEAALKKRGVSVRALEDGMSAFRAELPADKAATAFTVLDQIAIAVGRRREEKRSIGTRRADAFSDIFDQLAENGSVHLQAVLDPCCAATSASAGSGRRTVGAKSEPDSTILTADRPAGAGDNGKRDTSVQVSDSETETPEPNGEPDSLRSADYTDRSAAVRPKADDDPAATPAMTPTAPASPDRSDPTAGLVTHPPQPFAAVWGLGTHQGRTIGLNVTIAATTLAGLDDLPGELDGHGTIPADMARALAASAVSITAVAVNPACGTALDLGRTTYRPRLSQRDAVTRRDQTCRFPSCRQPAWRCQMDHSDEFCPGKDDGGVTCPCNLACLCKFHRVS